MKCPCTGAKPLIHELEEHLSIHMWAVCADLTYEKDLGHNNYSQWAPSYAMVSS